MVTIAMRTTGVSSQTVLHRTTKVSETSFLSTICKWRCGTTTFEGSPFRKGYMEIDTVRSMIGRGFRLGLHGHQHQAQARTWEVWLPNLERLAVISAGSLCSGWRRVRPRIRRMSRACSNLMFCGFSSPQGRANPTQLDPNSLNLAIRVYSF